MPKLSIIAAIAENNAIGKNNQLLCHISQDLQRFKQLTLHHTVIMGRNTFLSLPKGALPQRKNIVITTQSLAFPECLVAHSLEEALKLCKEEEEVFIIGGSSLYHQTIYQADKLYLTYIHASFDADAFFPPFDQSQWQITYTEEQPSTDTKPYSFSFINYERIE
jgi:dihydrofolate reductase